MILLAVGLAMDACAVSLTNGLRFPQMRRSWVLADGLCFGLLQGIMPLTGFLLGGCFAAWIAVFDRWIALFLLGLIGGRMLWESRSHPADAAKTMNAETLLLQGIATSIDAFAVGVSFAAFAGFRILPAVGIIAGVTALLSMSGVLAGKRFGEKLHGKAEAVGGIILILLGIKIFFGI